jgi:hypothetical protein
MTTTNFPHLPIPAGAAADEWCFPTSFPEDVMRFLTWSNHNAGQVGVAVDGAQFGDGQVFRHISLYDVDGKELTATDARKLAAALLNAADALEALQ